MSVIFTPSGESPVTIGGTTLTGPFPLYSIQSNRITNVDGVVIGYQYTIVVRGNVLVDPDIDLTISGARQSNLHKKMIQKLQIGIDNSNNYGRLEIVPYGGNPYPFDFIDAQLISINIPAAASNNQYNTLFEYEFTFNATMDASNRTIDNEFWLNAAEESWDFSQSELVGPVDIANGEFKKTYTLTHTVSATGKRSVDSTGNFTHSSWHEAKKWVQSRLVNDPANAIIQDFFGGPEFTQFLPAHFDDTATSDIINLAGYKFFNHVRNPNSNLGSGTYSVTETWEASEHGATLEIEINIEESETQIAQVVVSGSVTGQNATAANAQTTNRYANALLYFQTLDPNIFGIANDVYQKTHNRTLRQIPIQKSIGHGTSSGVITFSYGFDDSPQLIDNSISSSLTITDDNEFRDIRVVAIIPIIAKANGPEIQNMNTTPERRRSLQFDCVMDRDHRTVRPIQPRELIETYRPAGENVNIQTCTENFSYNDGSYSLNVDWVY